MDILPELYPGQLHLVLAPHRLRASLVEAVIVYLARQGPVRVLDGGNHFNAYRIGRELRRHVAALEPALERIQVARAFTCYQVAALLYQEAPIPRPTLVLELLSTFQDENVPLDERRRLLDGCLGQLRRLSRQAPVLVSAAPAEECQAAELLSPLEAAADRLWRFETPAPAAPARLF